MRTLASVILAVVVAGVLVGGTALMVNYLHQRDEEPEVHIPEPPVTIETEPGPSETAPPLPPEPSPSPRPPEPTPPEPAPSEPQPHAQPPTEPAEVPREAPARGPGPERSTEMGLKLAEEGRKLAEQGHPVRAQATLSRAVKAGVGGDVGRRVRKTLHQLADEIHLGRRIVPQAPNVTRYQVVRGDNLTRIGWQYLIPYELIMRINGLDSTAIRAGQTLKVVQGPIHLVIIKSNFELQAWLEDVCLRSYPIGVGENNSTPEGTFTVQKRLKNPVYQPQHRPRSDWRDAGAEDNPLGTRWIEFRQSFGIHGTIEPDSIGRTVSEGCIRMHNEHVEEIYDMVVKGASKITIRP